MSTFMMIVVLAVPAVLVGITLRSMVQSRKTSTRVTARRRPV